ncbi:MAG: PEP-CTERM sorting domain-containing protein [Puniceicoccales bacterium]|nr:PEP-CTERM sorting domain-containing protein [Puniceicoccales bacterium]
MDMTGNVREWTDSPNQTYPIYRFVRGASHMGIAPQLAAGASRDDEDLYSAQCDSGFRVASLAPIPEPSTYGVIGGALVGLLCLVRRKRRAVAP